MVFAVVNAKQDFLLPVNLNLRQLSVAHHVNNEPSWAWGVNKQLDLVILWRCYSQNVINRWKWKYILVAKCNKPDLSVTMGGYLHDVLAWSVYNELSVINLFSLFSMTYKSSVHFKVFMH